MKFKNKKILITGAASGIGKSLAEEFANEGSILILSDIDVLKLKDFVNELKLNGAEAFGYEANVSHYKNMVDFSNLVLKEHNYIDVLINNAGINKDNLYSLIWKKDKDISMNKLDTHLTNLKNQLKHDLGITANFQSQDKTLRLLIN